jgi:brefeldin A-resistance guanine nucleotide exchange factor 1
MSSSGYLVPPSGNVDQDKLWVETWKRLDRFLPDLRKELDLDPKENETVGETVPSLIAEQKTEQAIEVANE